MKNFHEEMLKAIAERDKLEKAWKEKYKLLEDTAKEALEKSDEHYKKTFSLFEETMKMHREWQDFVIKNAKNLMIKKDDY